MIDGRWSMIGDRILVVGMSGSGKTTIAAELARRLGIGYTDLDAIQWRAGWTPVPVDEFRAAVQSVIAADRWIIAGNYFSRQGDLSFRGADTIVWLDLPLLPTLWRVAKRSVIRSIRREELWGSGNYESLNDHLRLWDTDRSMPAYVLRYHAAKRREQLDRILKYGQHARIVRLTSQREIDIWLQRLDEIGPED